MRFTTFGNETRVRLTIKNDTMGLKTYKEPEMIGLRILIWILIFALGEVYWLRRKYHLQGLENLTYQELERRKSNLLFESALIWLLIVILIAVLIFAL